MIIKHNDLELELLGDPHLGRRFLNGVPLSRRGERESMVWDDFNRSIQNTKADIHICMGDIFDKPVVPFWLILKTYRAYATAAANNLKTTYVLLRGNHDADRDLERSSAFDVLVELLRDTDVKVVRHAPESIGDLAFFPWHPIYSAEQLVQEFYDPECWPDGDAPTTVFGHWDVEDFGNDNPNMIPVAALKEAGVKTAYTGHDHKTRSLKIEGLPVEVVGSMQPYAHGEEPDDSLYVTATLAEVIKDTAKFKDKALRVLLAPGELFDLDVDYLQLTIKRINKDGDEEADDDDLDINSSSIDVDALFVKAMKEEELDDDDIIDQVLQKILEKKALE